MASRRTKIMSVAAVAALGGGGYFLQFLLAAQGGGSLAQAPLNTQVQIPPAFIMGVDNSGSMTTDELLFRTAQGDGFWNASRRSFFNDTTGDPNESGTSYSKAVDSGVPRPDMFGAARSPIYNRAYFNPAITYVPWLDSSGEPEDDSPPDAAKRDPRESGGTRDFTAVESYTYTFPAGSRLSAGTEYRASANCNRNGVPGTGWRTLTEDLVFDENCSTQVRYYRAVVYLPDDVPAPAGYDLTKRIRVVGAGPLGIDLWRYDYVASNFTTGGDEAVQNFANWWTYYGNRNRSMIAAMTHSLADINNIRVGYFQINPPYPGTDVQMHDMGNPAEKQALYAQMRALNASGNTPTRRATRYMGDQFRRTDRNAPVQLACQKNAGMLFTDGYTNDNALSGSMRVGNADENMGSPFADSASNTIADIAAWMYNDNIRPDLTAGQVPVPAACSTTPVDPRLDCQTNPHVNFYGVTLGARGHVYGVDAAATADPYSNPPAWGATGSMNLDPRNVDDIWHASLNSRGEFINAQSPTDVTAAMRRILSAVSAGASPSGSVALTGARIGTGSMTVTPHYEARNEGTDWSSELRADIVTIDPTTRTAQFTEVWEASEELPSPGARKVFFAEGASVRRFNDSNVTLDKLCSKPAALYPGMSRCNRAEIEALGIGVSEAVRYLLGDVSLEKRNAGGTLRDRKTTLGDIVNSTPVVVSPLDDYGYRGLGGTLATGYANYLNTKKASHRHMVYVGANDGMLHAFDGGMGANGVQDSNGGREEFAYVPATALGHMGNLLFPYDPLDENDQKFAHRYFVDGPVVASDALIDGSWGTALVGTAGAGGRSVFALDVTDPDDFSTSSRLWEISDLDLTLSEEVRENIGHVLGKPVVLPIKTKASDTPRWVAIFGNGYNSASKKAVLFVVDIADNPTIRMIEATETSGAPTGQNDNGLGNIVVVDQWGGSAASGINLRVRDGLADTAYAADQRGAVWKFDLRDLDPADVSVPLFTSRSFTEDGLTYRQPITGGIEATTGQGGGIMLYFGTGSFVFDGDQFEDDVQSLYAVNDIERGATTATVSRTNLLGYSVATTLGVRTMTAGIAPLVSRGWYVDLPAGERFVGYPRIATGTIFMPTYQPQVSAADCSTDGFNWLFGLNARTGAPGLSGVRFGSPDGTLPVAGTAAIKLDTQGTAPVKDVAVMAIPRVGPASPPPPGGGPPGTPPAPPGQGCWMMVTVAGAQQMYLPYPCGRQSWRQLQ